MAKSKEITLEDAAKIDERLKKEGNNKPVPLGRVLEKITSIKTPKNKKK